MKLLFDQNLSHRLVVALEDVFAGSQHVRAIGLAEADDLAVWNYAIRNDFVIVTQDSDYADWNKLLGTPPWIVWVRCGNASTDTIEKKLRSAVDLIRLLETESRHVEVIEVW
jgi:predicted nuclease of predicted toxin-antitoxin system